MQRILLLIIGAIYSTYAVASEAIIQGGFIPDYKQWESGYFVTVSQVDGEYVKGAYIQSEKQEVKIPQGTHTIRLNCAFEVKPKTALVGEKEITMIFTSKGTYKLSAIINFNKNKRTRSRHYCEPNIVELKANK